MKGCPIQSKENLLDFLCGRNPATSMASHTRPGGRHFAFKESTSRGSEKDMSDILADQEEREWRIKKAREVLHQIKLHFGKRVRCEVLDYDGLNYRVRFSRMRKDVDVPRKYIDDWNLEDRAERKPHTDYWEELFEKV